MMKTKLFVSLLCAFFLLGCATESYDGNGNGNGNNSQVQKPGETMTGNTTVPTKPVPKAYSVGAACDDSSYDMFCDGDRVVKCAKGKITAVDCALYEATCEIFADFPGIANCVYPEDVCDTPGRIVKKCTRDDYYKYEYLDVRGCSMSSNGNPQIVILAPVVCAEECSESKGCFSKTCSDEDAYASDCSSDGKFANYCEDGLRHTINCANMGTRCVVDSEAFADCEDWGDN